MSVGGRRVKVGSFGITVFNGVCVGEIVSVKTISFAGTGVGLGAEKNPFPYKFKSTTSTAMIVMLPTQAAATLELLDMFPFSASLWLDSCSEENGWIPPRARCP